MHGLKEHGIGTREKQIDVTRFPLLIDIIAEVRQVWHDQIQDHGRMTVSHAKPQPQVTATHDARCVHVVVDMDPTLFGMPLLLSTSYRYALFDSGLHLLEAIRMWRRVDKWSLMEQSNSIEACQNENNLCNFWAGGELLDLQEVVPHHGMLVAVDIAHGLWQWNIEQEINQAEEPQEGRSVLQVQDSDEDIDMTAWTQIELRSVSRSRSPPNTRRPGTSRFIEAHIFEENNGIPKTIPMNQVPVEMVKEYIEEQIRHQGDETTPTRAELFEIHPNPPNIISRNAIGFIWRPLTSQQPSKVIVLLDILLIPAGTISGAEAAGYRNAMHVRQTSTRNEMLSEIGINAMCQTEDCVVVTRGSSWERDETSVRHHENGDYFLISAAHMDAGTNPVEVMRDFIDRQSAGAAACDNRITRRRIERDQPESDSTDLLQNSIKWEGRSRQTQHNASKQQRHSDDDVFSAMATSRPPRRYTSARVYTMTDDEHQIIVPIPIIPESHFRTYVFRSATEGHTAEQRAAHCLNPVVPNPEDRESKKEISFILDDDTQRPNAKIPILLDVNVVTNQPRGMGPTDEWRETTYVSQRTNRYQFLTEVQLGPWCHRGSCIVQMGGRLWRSHDPDTWALFPGIYAIVTVLNEQCEVPFHVQWRQRNGPSQQADRSHTSSSSAMDEEASQGREEHLESSPSQIMGSDPDSDLTGLLQRVAIRHIEEDKKGQQTPARGNNGHIPSQNYQITFAKAANARLPPPGNGVKFCDIVEIYNEKGVQLARDRSMRNSYIEGLCDTRDGIEGVRTKGILNEVRFEYLAPIQERQTLSLQHLLPIYDSSQEEMKDLALGEIINKLRADYRAKFTLKNDWHNIPALHQKVRDHVAHQGEAPRQRPNAIHIYTDGSSCKDKEGKSFAAWAYTVELEFEGPNGPFFCLVGYEAANLQRSDLSDLHIGEKFLDSMEAEACAIFWALAWIASWTQDWQMRTVLHVDCMAALYASSADWRIPQRQGRQCEISQKARYMAQLLEAEGRNLHFQHIRAHEGAIGNEAADSVARTIAQGKFGPLTEKSPWIKKLAMHKDLQHIWLLATNDIPTKEDEHAFIESRPTDPSTVHEIQQDREVTDAGNEEVEVCLQVATINVFSALEKTETKMTTRRACLAEQFFEKGWNIIAIQESRYRHSIQKSDDRYLMYTASATDAGQFGMEIWFDKQTIIGTSTIKPEHVTIQETSPTIMVAALRHPQLKWDIIAIHAPQRQDPKAPEWWGKLKAIIARTRRSGKPTMLLGDCNSRIGSEGSNAIGRKDPEQECRNGLQFRGILEDFQLYAVNTDEDIHKGSSHTYHKSRIDYMVVYGPWASCFTETWIEPDVDLMHEKEDHLPLVGQMRYMTVGTSTKKANKAKYDTSKAHDPANKGIIEAIFNTFKIPDWDTSLDDHVHWLNKHLQKGLAKTFPVQKYARHRPFIGDETWKIIQDRKIIQKESRQVNRRAKQELLRQCFTRWAHKDEEERNDFHHQYLALLQMTMEEMGKKLKIRIKQDKDDYLQQQLCKLEEAVQTKNAKEIYRALRAFRPQTPRQRIKMARPLPTLKGDDGYITNKTEWNRAWLDHWMRIECADEATYEHHIGNAIDKRAQLVCSKEDIQEAWPCLSDIELILHRLKRNKAPGQDGITADIFKLGGAPAAKIIYGIAIKQIARGEVPIIHKGCEAVPLYKAKGTMEDRSSYRSIALQCSLAKILSRTWRKEIEQTMANMATVRQGGARKSLGPNAHITRIRCMQALATTKKTSFGLAVMDLESAFYKTVRGFLTELGNETISAEAVAHLFGLLGLAPTLFDDFMEEIRRPKIMASGGTNKAVERVVNSMMQDAWARLPGDGRVMIPNTGTKPGDPLADILFSLVMVRYCNNVERRMGQTIPHVKGLMMTWIDDIAVPFLDSAHNIRSTAQQVMTIPYDEAVRLGLKPTIKRGKTEILLAFHGAKAQIHKRQVEADEPKLSFVTEHYGVQQVEVVEELEYLGALIDRQCNIMPEIKRNTSRATSAVKPLRKAVFTNPNVSTHQKTGVLTALGLSRVAYTAGSWPTLRQPEYNVWHARIMALYRLTVPRYRSRCTPK